MLPQPFLMTIIRPTLAALATVEPRLGSMASEQLMLGTSLTESGLKATVQSGGGPALSFYQIEPTTYADVAERYLPTRRPDLLDVFAQLIEPDGSSPIDQLEHNHALACAVARLRYWMSPMPLAAPGDWKGHARCWKQIYNTEHGKGSEEHFLRAVEPIKHFWDD